MWVSAAKVLDRQVQREMREKVRKAKKAEEEEKGKKKGGRGGAAESDGAANLTGGAGEGRKRRTPIGREAGWGEAGGRRAAPDWTRK